MTEKHGLFTDTLCSILRTSIIFAGIIGSALNLKAETVSAEEIVRRYHQAFFYAGRDFKAQVAMRNQSQRTIFRFSKGLGL